jgi:hypothetical protein
VKRLVSALTGEALRALRARTAIIYLFIVFKFDVVIVGEN